MKKGEDVWSEVRGLPQNQSKFLVCPSLNKDNYVGTKLENGGAPLLIRRLPVMM